MLGREREEGYPDGFGGRAGKGVAQDVIYGSGSNPRGKGIVGGLFRSGVMWSVMLKDFLCRRCNPVWCISACNGFGQPLGVY